MNIRNLLFTSMIFCAASSFAKIVSLSSPATADRPEVSLTKQEQKDIQSWIKTTKSLLNKKTQGLVKESLVVIKDSLVFSLNKMQVGKTVCEYEQEIEEAEEKIFGPKLEKLHEKNNEKLSSFMVAWNCPLPFLWVDDLFWVDDCEESDEKITEEHVVKMKKAIAMYSFAIKFF
jgi:hypothetical protein